jgi:hypothetical protein
MAGRKAGWYVYAVRLAEGAIAYIGKGSGNRHKASAKRVGGEVEILQRFTSERQAFKAEKALIATHNPPFNKTGGGDGGRSRRRIARQPKWVKEINEIGVQRYAARFLLTKLNEHNCEQYGMSKLGLIRTREIANGPWR